MSCSSECRNGRYPWIQTNNVVVVTGPDDIPESKSIVADRCSDMNEIIHEHNLRASDIPIQLIFNTVETGDIESFIVFCEKKEREKNGKAM